MFDGNEETCWNSDQGTMQSILLDFQRRVAIKEIHITFQGGFAAKLCQCYGGSNHSEILLEVFYPEDSNSKQVFRLIDDKAKMLVNKLRLSFPESTDFFGRIIVYHLDIVGYEEEHLRLEMD
jgi:hypothetical protein